MSEWDKTRDALAKLMKENYDKTRNLDLINTWYQARVLGDRLQEKQRETQFLLNCESSMLRECRLQLGYYMKLQDKIDKITVLANKWANVQPSPYADAYSDPPQSVSITRAYGAALKEVLEAEV